MAGWLTGARARWPEAVFCSALSGEGVGALLELVLERQMEEERDVLLAVDMLEPRSIALLHELGVVLGVDYDRLPPEVRLRIDRENYGRMTRLPGVKILEVARRRSAS